ncbi:MAG: hypothetical protein ABGX04_09385 [Myxococcales bacterium]
MGIAEGLLFHFDKMRPMLFKLRGIGDWVRLIPGHVDPALAYHERIHAIQDDCVVDEWPIDLRG